MSGHRRTADGERLGDLADRAAAGAEQLDDRAAVAIAQGVERVAGQWEGGHEYERNKNATVSRPSFDGGRTT